MTVSAQQIVDEAIEGGGDEDDMPELADIGRDLELLFKRIHTRITGARNGTKPLAAEDAAEMLGEVVQLFMDHLAHTKAQEDHANWATEIIQNLETALGDGAEASQLHADDAEKIRGFCVQVTALVSGLQAALEAPEARAALEPWTDQFMAVQASSAEIAKLVDDLDLSLGDGDDPDDPDEADASSSTASGPAAPPGSPTE